MLFRLNLILRTHDGIGGIIWCWHILYLSLKAVVKKGRCLPLDKWPQTARWWRAIIFSNQHTQLTDKTFCTYLGKMSTAVENPGKTIFLWWCSVNCVRKFRQNYFSSMVQCKCLVTCQPTRESKLFCFTGGVWSKILWGWWHQCFTWVSCCTCGRRVVKSAEKHSCHRIVLNYFWWVGTKGSS